MDVQGQIKTLVDNWVWDSGTSLWVKMAQPVEDGGDLNVDVTGNTIGLATSAKQLADGHNVTVDNVTGSPVPVQITDGTDNVDVETLSDDAHDIDGLRGNVAASAQYYRIDADTVKPARMDASTHSIQTIEYEHHEIHSGSSFTCSHQESTPTDINDRTIITFKTPDSLKYLHITVSASATAISLARIREAPTYTDNAGTTLAVYNRNRVGTPDATDVLDTSQNPDTAGSATYWNHDDADPPSEDGTIIAEIPLGAATSPVKSIGGSSRAQQEWVLKPATFYSFEVKSLDASDNTHWLEVDWYEHIDKD